MNKEMNPFQKLKFTIDSIGLQYIPSNDHQTITGESVYKFSRSPELQQADNDRVPYFKTQGYNQQGFKKQSAEFRLQEIQELKALYENQQKNLIGEINSLNLKLKEFEMRYEVKCEQNQRIKQELESKIKENSELRAYIIELEQKSSKKLSQSNVFERQRKLKQEIDRINLTVMDLAKELNTQKTTRKNIQKELDQVRQERKQLESSFVGEKSGLKKEISVLQEELEKRTELLEHSIRSARDEKVLHKEEIGELKQKHQLRVDSFQQQMNRLQQQIYDLKNTIIEQKYFTTNLQAQLSSLTKSNQSLNISLTVTQSQATSLNTQIETLTQKIQQLRLQVAYYQQQLEEERRSAKVKVVEVRDESLEMELAMYKKQCRELMKEKSILETVRRDQTRAEYTVVEENLVVLNRSQ